MAYHYPKALMTFLCVESDSGMQLAREITRLSRMEVKL